MTRNEFIDGFMARSSIDAAGRRPWGMIWALAKFYALPCACGEQDCDGWAMVRAASESIEDHLQFRMCATHDEPQEKPE